MAELEQLTEALAAAIERDAVDVVREVRQQICALHPTSEAAAEARYRLGLDALFVGRDLDRAMAHFDQAAASKHPSWAPAARTSLGLCLLHLGRAQKGLFELRKVAFTKEPSAHSVTALSLMESFCAAQKQDEEVVRIRKERVTQLERLLRAEALPPRTRGQYLMQLGFALADAGEKRRATDTLQAASLLGPAVLGTDEHALVSQALAP